MSYSVADHSVRLGPGTIWLGNASVKSVGELIVSFESADERRVLGGLRRSARIWLDDIELNPNFEQLTAPSLFNENADVHKVEIIGDDSYTIYRKGKGAKLTYALYRNAELLINWKPSPRDAETRIKIERMRFTRGEKALSKAEDPKTKRLKQIPEWGLF